jgi:UDP-N-acetyl-D-glucosamine dehydrogenase
MAASLSRSKGAIAETLVARFKSRDATVGVVGLGYVGLPLVCRFADAGFRTIGFDIDPAKLEKLGKGQTYIATVPEKREDPGNLRFGRCST